MRPQHFRFLILFLCCYALMGADVSPSTSSAVSSLSQIAFFTVALIACLILSAFYSGSETALVSLDKVKIDRLAEEGHKRARIVKRLIETPDKMLGLTLVGNNLVNVLTSQVGLLFVIALLNASGKIQHLLEMSHVNKEIIVTFVITALTLVFGEIIPKTISRIKADELALRYAYPLRISEFALGIIVHAVTHLTNFFVKTIGKRAEPASPDSLRDELRLLATMGEQSGSLLREQRRMIHSVLDLHRRTVEQVMVPLVDIVAVEKDTDVETFLRIASESGFSRIPVYDEQIYNIVGIVHLLDVIYATEEAQTIQPFIRMDIRFVPESKNINVLLKEIQRSRNTMVFVVDEYGGIVGLVTVEDLVEEIIGDVSDKRAEVPSIRLISPRILECEGRTEIDTLRDRFGVQMPSGDYETIAGYILEQTGAIPGPGDEIETENFVITVSDADARSIQKVRLRNKRDNFIRRAD